MLRETFRRKMLSRFFIGLMFMTLCARSRAARASDSVSAKPIPTIVFMTDFGVVDDSVAICKGVMYSIAPDVRIVDLTHEVTPFSILDGARFRKRSSSSRSAGNILFCPTMG